MAGALRQAAPGTHDGPLSAPCHRWRQGGPEQAVIPYEAVQLESLCATVIFAAAETPARRVCDDVRCCLPILP